MTKRYTTKNSISELDKARIKSELRYGDSREARAKLGCSPELIAKVVAGQRQNDAVWAELQNVITYRKSYHNRIDNEQQPQSTNHKQD